MIRWSNNFTHLHAIACDMFSATLDDRILGGSHAQAEEFPWMVRLT